MADIFDKVEAQQRDIFDEAANLEKATADNERINQAITDSSGAVIGSGQSQPTGGPVQIGVGESSFGKIYGRETMEGIKQIAGSGDKSPTRQNIEGIAQAVGASPNVASGIGAVADAPNIMAETVMGIMQVFPGALITASGETLGDAANDVALAMGASPLVAQAADDTANYGLQLGAAPFAAQKGANLAARGAQGIARNLPGAQSVLREMGKKVIEAMPSALRPPVASSVLYDQVKQAGNPLVALPKYRRAAAAMARSEANLVEQGLGDTQLLQQATKAVTANKHPTGFEVVQDVIQRVGEKIGNLRAGGGVGLGKQKTLYKALAEDLDDAANSGAGQAYKLLKDANKAANREFAIKELDEIFDATMGKALAGQPRHITSSNFNTALNKIRAERKSNPLFEKGFQEGQKNHLDNIEKTLEKLNEIKIRPPAKNVNAGSLLLGTRMGVAGGLGAAAGGLITGTPMGVAIGGSLGTAAGAGVPAIISRILQTPEASRHLVNLLKKNPQISVEQLRALGTIVVANDTNTKSFMESVDAKMKSSQVPIEEKIKVGMNRDQMKRKEAAAEAELKAAVRTSVKEVDSKKSEPWGIGIGIERVIGNK
jgi:hypothetical protein